MAHARIQQRERDRMAKLFAQGRNKADIGRIMGRSRRIVWKTLKEIKASRRGGGPGRRRTRPPQRAVMRWWPTPAEILDAFGE